MMDFSAILFHFPVELCIGLYRRSSESILMCKTLTIFVLVAVIVIPCVDGDISVKTDRHKVIVAQTAEDAFAQYVNIYRKKYSPAEYNVRLDAFKGSLERIKKANSQRNHTDSAFFGLTRFSDMTPVEFNQLLTVLPEKQSFVSFTSDISYPPKFDWRKRNVVSPVRNQLNCGACWAFSTIESIETMNALKTGKLTELSVQQMIDCSNSSNHGCNGGDTCTALEWLKSNRVQLVESSVYPFTATDTGHCKNPESSVRVMVRDYTCSRFVGNEETMLALLANSGPLVAAVDAAAWQDYLGGVIQYHCDAGRNHAVQIVGYDTTVQIPYYIVRNSWGVGFGNDGYLYIAIGKNLCGIAEEVSTVTVV
ncbi:cathepsin O-like [Ornithodoros turicata]|uniref:cathepsin O-like n=1 Tax=Ornithodoros turicata TaxID=34597 RepID=UPI003139AA40